MSEGEKTAEEWFAEMMTPPQPTPKSADAPKAKPTAQDEYPDLKVRSAREFIGELKPRPWRVKRLQPLDAKLCAIFSDPGDGKSFFLSDVGGCIQRGASWNGNPVVKGRVVCVVAEGSGDFRYRHETYRRHNGIRYEDLFPIIDAAPDLMIPREAAALVKQIQAAGGCDVLIIDTVSATFSGDEKGSDMNRYLRNIGFIQRSLNCTVWLISHRGKDSSKGMRGWSGQKAAFDVEVEITRPNGPDDDLRIAKVTKSKGAAAGAEFPFKLKFIPLGKDSSGEEYGSCVVEYQGAESAAVRYVKKRTKGQRDALGVMQKLCAAGAVADENTAINALVKAKGYKASEIKSYHIRDARLMLATLVEFGDIASPADGSYAMTSIAAAAPENDPFAIPIN